MKAFSSGLLEPTGRGRGNSKKVVYVREEMKDVSLEPQVGPYRAGMIVKKPYPTS